MRVTHRLSIAARWISAAVLALMVFTAVARRAGSSFGRVNVGRLRVDLAGFYLEYRAPRPASTGPTVASPGAWSGDSQQVRLQRFRDLMLYQAWYGGLGRQVSADWVVLKVIAMPEVRQEGARWVSDGYYYVLRIPDWVIVLLSGAPPLAWAFGALRRRRRASRRAAQGLCAKCGYDLRAHTAGARSAEHCATLRRPLSPVNETMGNSRCT